MVSKAFRPTRALTESRIMASLCSRLGSGFVGSPEGACAWAASGLLCSGRAARPPAGGLGGGGGRGRVGGGGFGSGGGRPDKIALPQEVIEGGADRERQNQEKDPPEVPGAGLPKIRPLLAARPLLHCHLQRRSRTPSRYAGGAFRSTSGVCRQGQASGDRDGRVL